MVSSRCVPDFNNDELTSAPSLRDVSRSGLARLLELLERRAKLHCDKNPIVALSIRLLACCKANR